MNFAIIVAGGNGSRLKSSSIPKQFIEIEGIPIFWYSIKKFLNNKNIDYIIVPCHANWISYAKEFVKKNNVEKRVKICNAGISRNASIENSINYINDNYKNFLKKDSVIITHDAARIFVIFEIVSNNFKEIKKFDVITTVVPSIDTIMLTSESNSNLKIPNREKCFLSQTPQTTKWNIIKDIYKNQKKSKWFNNSDLCKLALLNRNSIGFVFGNYGNFKITTDFDLEIAKEKIKKNI
ncbi:MAG: 2-C-methyl-D-erythritol 4-phosphate cytidylyltransferase [Mycoplasma sp.]|nr:2-C-methyl-D-erythritol 4-phosphate cytidylyltransferase [Mycoplasma sp.]